MAFFVDPLLLGQRRWILGDKGGADGRTRQRFFGFDKYCSLGEMLDAD